MPRFVHSEPAPVIHARLFDEPGARPSSPSALISIAPLLTTSWLNKPLLPTRKSSPLTQREPEPESRARLPLAPALRPTTPLRPLVTTPPATSHSKLLTDPLALPTMTLLLARSVPLLVTVRRFTLPEKPTKAEARLVHTEPDPVTTASLPPLAASMPRIPELSDTTPPFVTRSRLAEPT